MFKDKFLKFLKNITFILLFFVIALSQTLYSQLYNYKQYTVEDGFPQSNADDIFQDKDGYIWFATQNGAARFDGFNYFLIDKYRGINTNYITDINQDSKGNFWFSTKNGISEFRKDTVINYTVKTGLSSDIVRESFELPDGQILALTKNGTDIIYKGKIRKLKLKDIPVKFLKRKSGEILALSCTAIYTFSNNKLQKINYNYSFTVSNFYDIVETSDSSLWVSSDKGIFKIKDKKVIKHLTKENGLPDNKINCLLVDSENNLWYASEEKGCGKYFKGSFYNFTAENGMPNTSVLSLFEDREKNIWIGGRNGATMINPRIPFVQFLNISPYKSKIVMGITSDKNDNLWFCTYGSGLVRYNGKSFTNFNKNNGAFDNHFFDAETDTNGNLWFASSNSGIIFYDYKHFKKIIEIDNKKISSRVLTIFKDSYNNLWFGTNGEGFFKYDGKKLSRIKNMPALNILAINEDNNGNLWFGTINEGLYKFDSKQFIKIDSISKISPGIVRAITKINGTMWFGTSSDGIYSIKEEKGNYIQQYINKSNGLNSDNIYLLFTDKKNNLWVGTEKGVDKLIFDKNGNIRKIETYTKNEGFLGTETDLNGAFQDKNGDIWFGTVNGVLKYLPNIKKKNTVNPPVYLKNIKLNFRNTDLSDYCDSLSSEGLPVNLQLPYNLNHLTFEYIALCYSNPEKVKYKYRLIGEDKNWSPELSDRKVIFSNIEPGEYTFEVKAANDSGVLSKNSVRFSFIIKPPVWEQLWFKTIGLFLFLLIIYLIIDYRVRSLKRAKNELAKKVYERTIELKEQKEKIENINLKITDSINYAGKIQTAMMPANEMFKSNFSDSFVLYKPRDIVSGDFYWAKEIQRGYDSYTIIVAADSTGHGIPGALVSMLGMSLLNEIVRNEEIQKANSVLEKLRKEIKSSLNQKDDFDDRTEGFDMVVLIINKHTKELQYAGANNPLYIIRNNNLIVLEPTFNPVGIFLKEIPFKNNTFQLQPNDVIYLFSDGFEDQFNGKTGEKYKIKRFRELLLSIYKEDCDKQKQILEDEFYKWKGDYNQIDDVLVMGLKV